MKINKSIRNKCYSLGWSNPLCCTWTKLRFAIKLIYKHDGLIDRGVVSDILSLILENQFYGWTCIEKKLVIWEFPIVQCCLLTSQCHCTVYFRRYLLVCSSAITPLHLRSQERCSFLELGQISLKEVAVPGSCREQLLRWLSSDVQANACKAHSWK